MTEIWLTLSHSDIETEQAQCLDEGRDIEPLRAEFNQVLALDMEDMANQPRAERLLDSTGDLSTRAGYKYVEPSDLAAIRAARPSAGVDLPAPRMETSDLEERLHGAWTGRCAGCLLGKPVEGWRRDRMWSLLRDQSKWPLEDYFKYNSTPIELIEKYSLKGPDQGGVFADLVDAMPEDDDTNYTTTGLAVMEKYGSTFTPADVAQFWLGNIPILHTCTAERVAYRNLCLAKCPPESATFRNPFREWIGAQIRGDFWGYAAAGRPELAAEYAWRDASISHVKNGIYGEMWVAAMTAAAFVTDDIPTVIKAGLAQIPEHSRLFDYVEQILEWRDLEIDYDTAVYRIHEMWNEGSAHHWCHTISNAMIVAIALLWGEGDFGRSICRAVQPCFDTDCNGATTGSILGILHGRRALPPRWVDGLNDTMHTGVAGSHTVRLEDMARRSAVVAAASEQTH